jgi:hydrogenase maturation factor
MAAWQADHDHVDNCSLLVSHVLVPPATEALLSSSNCTVVLQSRIGGNRVVDMLSGEQLPRIC